MTASPPPGREHLADLITRCIDGGDLRQGLACCQQLNRAYPDYAYGWYLASFLMKNAHNHRDALRAIDRALELADSEKYRLHRARCLFEAGDTGAAVTAVGLLKDGSFNDPALHGEVGSLLHLLGDYANALRHFSRAIELDGSNAEFRFNKAALQRYLGDAAGAEAGFDAVIRLKPEEFEAYNARAQLRKQTSTHNHIVEISAMISRTRDPVALTQLHFALAKEQEDIGDFGSAFASLKAGANNKRQCMQYSVATDLEIIDRICAVYDAGMFERKRRDNARGCDAADPIFILGMPRTGTTLVDRILSSHSCVYSAGEPNHFALELTRLAQELPGPAPASRADFVVRTASLDFRALGEAYLHSTRPLRDSSPFFIDKLPFNYLYVGLIHLALPRAKIINLQRHPMDTCYAVYKQLFKDAYPFSYDLGELGQYYVAYHRLMEHWNKVLPGVIHTMRYEDVVADFESESRSLLAYCGLPWEDQCLRFYQHTQASTTASALQVRQPIYDTSVGKWRRYSRELESLRVFLESEGIDTRQQDQSTP